MPDMEIRYGSLELRRSLRPFTKEARGIAGRTSQGHTERDGMEMEVNHNEEDDDENVDRVKITLSMIPHETPHRIHAEWREAMAAEYCKALRDVGTHEVDDENLRVETIEVMLDVGGHCSGAVYVVKNGKRLFEPPWVSPFFTHEYPYDSESAIAKLKVERESPEDTPEEPHWLDTEATPPTVSDGTPVVASGPGPE